MIGGLYILENAIAQATGVVKNINLPGDSRAQFKLSGDAGIALAASIELQLSNDPLAASSPGAAAWEVFGASLSGTGQGADVSIHQISSLIQGPWLFARGKVASISGAGASVDLTIVGKDCIGSLDLIRDAALAQTYSTVVIAAKHPVTIQARLHGTSGPLTAAFRVQLSNDITALTSPDAAAQVEQSISLAGTGAGGGVSVDNEYILVDGSWMFARVIIDSITGTDAKVDVNVTGV